MCSIYIEVSEHRKEEVISFQSIFKDCANVHYVFGAIFFI